jgi:LAGLIDADG endonuclease
MQKVISKFTKKKRGLISGQIARYNVGYSYHLSLHSRDSNILKDYKKKFLGIGVIYEYNNKPDCRIAVNKKSDLLYLINNIFDIYPLITKNQTIRYNLLKNGIINEIIEFKTLEEYQEYKAKSLLSITEYVNSQKSNNLLKNLSIDN